MKKYVVGVLLAMVTLGGALIAQSLTPRAAETLNKEVRHELVMLPYYSVFDILAYEVDGNVVTLSGQVTRPTLKSDAEKVVQRIEGVGKIANNIEVLPLSPADDGIRMAAYRALFAGDSPLMRYALGSVPSIHIIVKHGKITLVGEVESEADKTLANAKVSGIPGTFGTTNNLEVKKPSVS